MDLAEVNKLWCNSCKKEVERSIQVAKFGSSHLISKCSSCPNTLSSANYVVKIIEYATNHCTKCDHNTKKVYYQSASNAYWLCLSCGRET